MKYKHLKFTVEQMRKIDIEASLYSLSRDVSKLLRVHRLQSHGANAKCACVQCEIVRDVQRQLKRAQELLEEKK